MKSIDCLCRLVDCAHALLVKRGYKFFLHPNSIHRKFSTTTEKNWEKNSTTQIDSVDMMFFFIFFKNVLIMEFLYVCRCRTIGDILMICSNSTVTTIKTTTTMIRLHLFISFHCLDSFLTSSSSSFWIDWGSKLPMYDLQIFGFLNTERKKNHTLKTIYVFRTNVMFLLLLLFGVVLSCDFVLGILSTSVIHSVENCWNILNTMTQIQTKNTHNKNVQCI